MPEIGATLREARQRRRIDVFDVESQTKIRAKYLRALEEEEWDLLPGPTYVKTFLRTYAEFLGLDAKLLVEEYKQRFERPGPQELTPFSTNLGSRRERRRARGPVISPGVIVGVCFVLLIGVLAGIGILWDDSDDATTATTPAGVTPTPTRTPSRPTSVRLTIVPEARVQVCLLSRTGSRLIDGRDLRRGQVRRFRGRRFRVGFSNGSVHMRVGGRTYAVPSGGPIGYDVRPGRRPVRLSRSTRPRCA
jgi:cytoskeleton protein RodZ